MKSSLRKYLSGMRVTAVRSPSLLCTIIVRKIERVSLRSGFTKRIVSVLLEVGVCAQHKFPKFSQFEKVNVAFTNGGERDGLPTAKAGSLKFRSDKLPFRH